MIWLWIIASVICLYILYVIVIRVSARNLLLGVILALAFFAVIGSIYLISTGKLQWLWVTGSGLVPWIGRWFFLRNLFLKWKNNSVSKIQSDTINLEISHKSGVKNIEGIITKNISYESLKGDTIGIKLSDLSEENFTSLKNYCHRNDQKALHLLEVYENQAEQPQQKSYYQEFNKSSSGDNESRQNSSMTRQQALDILGLEENNLSREMILQAHRSLISQLHPDKGGSQYLASLINQARDFLLKSF